MRNGAILAVTLVCHLAFAMQSNATDTKSHTDLQTAARQLFNGAETVRSQAVKQLVSHGVSAIPVVQKVLCDTSAQGFELAWPSAAKAAGELKAHEVVPCLLRLLAWNIPPAIGNLSMKPNETLISVDPAFAALLRIGEPAVPTIRFYLPFLNPTQVDMAMRLLQTIGTPAAKEAAEHYLRFLEREVDHTKQNVEHFSLEAAAKNANSLAALADKYQHHEVYEVLPGVQMTPRFDAHGIVCEMQVEPTHFRDNGVDFAKGIDEHNVQAVVDQLVPATERGADMGTSEDCVGVCMTTHEYSNVLVKILSGWDTRLIIIKWRNRSCL